MTTTKDESFHVEDLDFSCQILLQNLSDQALMLEDSHIDFGEWPLRQPTNIIEGGREGVVYLQGRRKSLQCQFFCSLLTRFSSQRVQRSSKL